MTLILRYLNYIPNYFKESSGITISTSLLIHGNAIVLYFISSLYHGTPILFCKGRHGIFRGLILLIWRRPAPLNACQPRPPRPF